MSSPGDFTHVTYAQRVSFGTGKAQQHAESELSRLEAARPMVIAGPGAQTVAEKITQSMTVALWWHDVLPHVPMAEAKRARRAAMDARIDAIITVGGGSATGLAKAIALTQGTPIIAVPTTYAGSEATPVWGLTDAARKTTGIDDRVLPAAIVYDASLTFDLPVDLSVASGLNALAHCVDSLWAPRANPINAAVAGEGIRALAAGLPTVKDDPSNVVGREQCLYGAYMSAVAFASAGSGLHHKICHVLGGAFDLPHAQTHAIVLPHVLAIQGARFPAAAALVARALAADDALVALNRLREHLGAPTALRHYGFREADIPEAIDLVRTAVAHIDTDLRAADIEHILQSAWEGTLPRHPVDARAPGYAL